MSGELEDTADLLAKGQNDPNPEPVTNPDDPSYVEPYQQATPVNPDDDEQDEDDGEDEDGEG